MRGISVVEFQKEYSEINLKMMREDIKKYDMAIIVGYTIELEHGFIVKKINKTNSRGTKFTFKACESKEEPKKYREVLSNLIDDYNKKYGTNYCWE